MAERLLQVVGEVSSHFGMTLKAKQSEAIISFMSGKDCVCIPADWVW